MEKPQRDVRVPLENLGGEMTKKDDPFDISTTLDRENLEVAWLRQDIIDKYEKRSAELLKHLDSMEAAFDFQRSEDEERETKLRRENEELRHELAHGCRAHVAELLVKEQGRELERAQHVVQAVQVLKSILKEERIARKAHMKELGGKVEDLLLTLEKKEEEHEIEKRREEMARRLIEEENDDLRQKASLGWMLGCLSELYMRLDPDVRTRGIMKLVRKVKRILESGNRVFRAGGVMPSKLEVKSRSNPIIMRTNKPKESTDELPDIHLKKLRLNKCFWELEAKYLRKQAEEPRKSFYVPLLVPSKKEAAASKPCASKDHSEHKHFVFCHQGAQRRRAGPSAEVRLLKSEDQAAKPPEQTSCNETKKILCGLVSGMNYLMSQERLRKTTN